MYFTEEDIQFEKLSSSSRFEELCFDLLLRRGFYSLSWRQGGPDQGRDIEAYLTVSNPVVGTYREKWFVECKWYTAGVPVSEITTKFDWAEVEGADHLLIITSAYLSNSTKEWIENKKNMVSFRVHQMEGKQLKKEILCHEDLIVTYFNSNFGKMFTEALNNWIYHDILPNGKILDILYENLDINKMKFNELAFIWTAYLFQEHEIEFYRALNGKDFSFEFLAQELMKSHNCDDILSEINICKVEGLSYSTIRAHTIYKDSIQAKMNIIKQGKIYECQYSYTFNDEGEGVEVLIEQSEDINIKVRRIEKIANEEQADILNILHRFM
jgi:hypothetical protein